MTTETPDRMAWSGICENCLATWVVYPHHEADNEIVELIDSGPELWEGYDTCQVCDGTIEWNGSDPVEAVIRNV